MSPRWSTSRNHHSLPPKRLFNRSFQFFWLSEKVPTGRPYLVRANGLDATDDRQRWPTIAEVGDPPPMNGQIDSGNGRPKACATKRSLRSQRRPCSSDEEARVLVPSFLNDLI
jgi:hypothetical protein